MTCVIVAVAAFLAGCEWMILMRKRQARRMERAAEQSDGTLRASESDGGLADA